MRTGSVGETTGLALAKWKKKYINISIKLTNLHAAIMFG